jgi:hypothetical protein
MEEAAGVGDLRDGGAGRPRRQQTVGLLEPDASEDLELGRASFMVLVYLFV